MNVDEFRVRGKEMVDYICRYMETLGSRRVTPNIEPGYLKNVLPSDAPQDPEDWEDIMADVENKIMPGVSRPTSTFPVVTYPGWSSHSDLNLFIRKYLRTWLH